MDKNLQRAIERFMGFFIGDSDPASLLIPDHVTEEGPQAIADFTEAFAALEEAKTKSFATATR